MKRRYLDFRFDVTGLTDEEVGQLALEVSVQCADSEHHPDVPHPESEVVEIDDEEAQT